jgi:cytochrome b
METKQVTVWDPLVRILHWSLVLAFAAAYLTGEEWDNWEEVHEIGGYAALGLISFRIIWGFVGSKYARFSDFIYSPKAVIEYLKSLLTTHPKHYLGHNPAGGWMILLLMAGVLATGFTGLELLAEKEGEGILANMQAPALISVARAESEREEARERAERGERAGREAMGVPVVQSGQTPQDLLMPPQMAAPTAPQMAPAAAPQQMPQQMAAPAVAPQALQPVVAEADEDEEHEGSESEGEMYWEEMHELAANLTLFLVILHILGVIVSSRLHNENLARAMVTGKKNMES